MPVLVQHVRPEDSDAAHEELTRHAEEVLRRLGFHYRVVLLSKGDMLVIDFFVRRDHRTPEGASGKSLLLKIFRARSELSSGLVEHEGNDFAYKEVRKDAAADYDSGTNPG